MEEELMTHDIEEKLEEEEDIDEIADDQSIQPESPLTSGHIPLSEMGIVPPPDNMVMDISNFTFNQLKKRIVQERGM